MDHLIWALRLLLTLSDSYTTPQHVFSLFEATDPSMTRD
jgi:hypothetical protein